MNEIISERVEVKREVAVLWKELDVKKNSFWMRRLNSKKNGMNKQRK